MIPSWKIKRLIELGKDFNCPFHHPPFNGDPNEASFDIHDLKGTKRFQDFLVVIISLQLHYEYAKYKKHIHLAIQLEE